MKRKKNSELCFYLSVISFLAGVLSYLIPVSLSSDISSLLAFIEFILLIILCFIPLTFFFVCLILFIFSNKNKSAILGLIISTLSLLWYLHFLI